MERMATAVIEVRDGNVTNYPNDYASYLYRVTKEVAESGRGRAKTAKAAAVPETEEAKAARKARNRKLFDLKNQLQSLERQMAKYSEKKAATEAQLSGNISAQEADRLKAEHISLVEKLSGIEEKWFALQQEQEKLEKSAETAP
jgi:predicted  nucleic acid-binding Zn-ribbon protein